MKILIADDEKMSRVTLRSMLSEIDLPFELVGEAADGESMIKKIKALEPSLVIVDIHMPKLNGLDAIKKTKDDYPDIQWIVLTGFSKFQYAKQSIDLGVYRYLLKPVNPEELRNALKELYTQYRKSFMNRNKQFENEAVGMFSGMKKPDQYYSQFANQSFTGWVLRFDSSLSDDLRIQKQQKYYGELTADIESRMDKNVNIAVFPLNDFELAVVTVFDSSFQNNVEQLKKACFLRSIELNSSSHFLITCIELPYYQKFSALKQEVKSLDNIFCIRILFDFCRKIALEDLKMYEKDKRLFEICSTLTTIQSCYINSDYLNYTKQASELKKLLKKDTILDKSKKANMAYFLKAAMDCEVTPLEPFSEWNLKIEQCGENMLAKNSTACNETNIIYQVKKYIDQNYMKEIGIAEISDALNITPNYLSSLFHRETGSTFTKYLTNTRMLKAKELLLIPNSKVKDVAINVGYYNTRYFTKLFKKYYKYYPSEFVDKFRKN